MAKNTISPFLKRKTYIPASPMDEKWPNNCKFILIDELEDLVQIFLENVNKDTLMAFDTETTGLDSERDYIVGYSFSFDGKTGYYVPLRHKSGRNIDPKKALDALYNALTSVKIVMYANLRFDNRMAEYENYTDKYFKYCRNPLEWLGYDMSKVRGFDVLQFCFFADSDNYSMIGLKPAAAHFLGIKMDTFEETTGGARFDHTDPVDSTYYASSDAIITFKLGTTIAIKMFTECKTSGQLDNDSLQILMRCENEKTLLKTELLDKYEKDLMLELEDLEYEMFRIAGYEFNIRSSKQVGALFDNLGIDTGIYTDSGAMSVGIDAIDRLEEETIIKYPFLKQYVKYKRLEKLRSSYIAVLKLVESQGFNFVRVPYKTTATATGRLACGAGKNTKGSKFFTPSLNIQNIPKQKSMEYYLIDLGDRSLFYEDLSREVPLIVIYGYQMLPIIPNPNDDWKPYKWNDIMMDEVESAKSETGEVIINGNTMVTVREYYEDYIEHPNYKYLGITESGDYKRNIRALFSAENIYDDYYKITLSNGAVMRTDGFVKILAKKSDESNYIEMDISDLCVGYDVRYVSKDLKDHFAEVENVEHVPKESRVFASWDYSGEELRLATNMSKETAWEDVYLNGGDLHYKTAIMMVGEEHYTKSVRKLAKGFNFALLYGAGPYNFVGTELNGSPMDLVTATDMVNSYRKGLPKLASWQKRIIDNAIKSGTVRSYFGRPRRMAPYVENGKKSQVARLASNHVVQSTGSDVLKIALIKLFKGNIISQTNDECRFLNTVHDEINFSLKYNNEVDLYKKLDSIQHTMTFTIPDWVVPIVVDGSIGNSYGLQLEIHLEDGVIHPKFRDENKQ